MPSLPQRLQPIPFDVAGTVAEIEACRRAAAAIDEAADVRQRAAEVARHEWQGPARLAFDAELAGVQREAADLAADLRATAGRLEAQLVQVRMENARRAVLRAEWERAQRAAG